MQRRHWLQLTLAISTTLSWPALAQTTPYPNGPVTVLAGVNPGGATDIYARIFAQSMLERLGQTFLVDNRPGAGGLLAAEAALRSPADGQTLLVSAPTVMIVAPYLHPKLTFDPVRDFTPIALLSSGPQVLVVPANSPFNSVADIVAQAQQGKSLTYASGGIGSAGHLTAAQFGKLTGLDLIHVPYKGDGQGVNDVVGGQVDLMFTGAPLVDGFVKSGRLKLLAFTHPERLASYPDTPTVRESGVPALANFDSTAWVGLYARQGTPPAIIETINTLWQEELRRPEVAQRLDPLGASFVPFDTPAAFDAFQQSERERWGKVIREADIQPE